MPIRSSDPSRDAGFTLVELLVVMIVVGLLAAIAIPMFLGQRQRARDLAVRSDMRHLALEMASRWSETGLYPVPTELQAAGVPFRASPTVTLTVVWADRDDFCMVATSSGSGPDRSGLGASVGVFTRLWTTSATTAPAEVTAGRPGCLTSRPVSTTNGVFTSSGYRATL